METNNKEKILKILVKNPLQKHTITSLAEETKISRPGTWKILKKLESEELIKLSPIGSGRTNTNLINLNWQNPLTEKTLELILTKEALEHQKWRFNFEKLEKEVDFSILFGSILHSPKQANDIDIINVMKRNKFVEINKILTKMQVSQKKDIHSINLTEIEFKKELQNKNKAYIDAVKNGMVLFGQENFVQFIKKVQNGN